MAELCIQKPEGDTPLPGLPCEPGAEPLIAGRKWPSRYTSSLDLNSLTERSRQRGVRLLDGLSAFLDKVFRFEHGNNSKSQSGSPIESECEAAIASVRQSR